MQAKLQRDRKARRLYNSRKKTLQLIDRERTRRGDFLIGQFKHLKKTSWHHCVEFVSISSNFYEVDDIGLVTYFIVSIFDTRKLLKGQKGGYRVYISNFYFHEHFLIRVIQRLGLSGIGEVGNVIYPILQWLILEKVPFKHLPDTAFFVMRDFVCVGNRFPPTHGLVFKTLLMREFMSDAQEALLKTAYCKLEENNFVAIMTDQSGNIIRAIPHKEYMSLISFVGNGNFWLRSL